VKDHWPDDEAEPRHMRLGGSSAIEDKMIREEVNGRSHHTFRAGRPNGGAAKSVRSVISGCHGVPNDLRQILDSRRAENRKRMASAASASTFSPGTCKAWLYRSDADRRNRWSCHRVA
jgi:hypothetical protein